MRIMVSKLAILHALMWDKWVCLREREGQSWDTYSAVSGTEKPARMCHTVVLKCHSFGWYLPFGLLQWLLFTLSLSLGKPDAVTAINLQKRSSGSGHFGQVQKQPQEKTFKLKESSSFQLDDLYAGQPAPYLSSSLPSPRAHCPATADCQGFSIGGEIQSNLHTTSLLVLKAIVFLFPFPLPTRLWKAQKTSAHCKWRKSYWAQLSRGCTQSQSLPWF